MKKGFTLIELLVVVLIIGILAAVALPQYQKAVAKSRTAELMLNVKSLRQAVEVYYLENGSYPLDFTSLSIEFAGRVGTDPGNAEGSRISLPNGNYCSLDISDNNITCEATKPNVAIRYFFSPHSVYDSAGYYCVDKESSTQKICLSLGGVYKGHTAAGEVYFLGK